MLFSSFTVVETFFWFPIAYSSRLHLFAVCACLSVWQVSFFFLLLRDKTAHTRNSCGTDMVTRNTHVATDIWDLISIQFASHVTCHVDTSVKMTHIMMNIFLCKEHTDRLVAPCNAESGIHKIFAVLIRNPVDWNPKSTLIWNVDL